MLGCAIITCVGLGGGGMPQFLNSGSQLSSRLGHADWFLHLFNRAAKRMTAISQLPGLDPRVVKRCTAVLVKIWCVCAPRGHCHEEA